MIDEPDSATWPSYREVAITRWRQDQCETAFDQVAEETPIALIYNDQPHVVMLATPNDLEDFALGFSITEGIVQRTEELQSIKRVPHRDGIELRILIDPERAACLLDKTRNLAGRTGCGLCGRATLAQAVRTPPRVRAQATITADELHGALAALHTEQRINRVTGAVHAAGWARIGEGLRYVREDVGRHNALDKLIGVLLRRREDVAAGFIVVTSRASYEMVQKAAIAGVGLLAAVSAPTALAVRLATATGITLVGFARPERHVVYTHPDRIHCSF